MTNKRRTTSKTNFGKVGADGKRHFLPSDRKTLIALGVPLTVVGIPMLILPGPGLVVTGAGLLCLGKAALAKK